MRGPAILAFVALALWWYPADAQGAVLTLENYLSRVFLKNQDLKIKGYRLEQTRAVAANQLKSSPLNTTINLENSQSKKLSTDILDSVDTVEDGTSDLSATLSKKLVTGSDVGLTYGYTLADGNSRKLPQDLRSYHSTYLNLSVSQPILAELSNIFHRREYKLAQKDEVLDELAFRKFVSDLLLQAVQAYYQLTIAQRKVFLHKSAVQIASRNLRVMEELTAGGLESHAKLLELQTDLLEKENQLYQAERDGYEKRAVFLELMDEPEKDDKLELLSPPLEPIASPWRISLDTVFHDALRYRADYKMELEREAKTRVQLDMRKSSTLPKLNLKSNYYLYGTDPEFGETFNRLSSQDFNSWSVGVELNMVIDRYYRQNQLAPLQISLKEGRHRKRSLEKRIRQELESRMSMLEITRRQYEATQKSLEIAKENFSNAEALYEKQYIKESEYLSGQRNLNQAEFNVFQSQVQFTLSYYQYIRAGGRLLTEFDVAVPEAP